MRKDAEMAFERLIKAIGGRIATSYNDVGAYQLDYTACYGGYNIERICNLQGGVNLPFGMERKSSKEFCAVVRFAIDVLKATRVREVA